MSASLPPRPRMLVIGDVMTDVIVRPDGPLVVGSDRRAKIGLYPGGSGCNQAAWLAHLGIPVAFAGRVGRRDLGEQEQALRDAGVVPVLAADDTRATGMLIVLLSEGGERSFLTDRGANDGLCDHDLPFSMLNQLDLVHVSGYALFTPGPRAAVMSLMAVARARGITVTVDPASVGFLEEVGPSNFLGWTSDASIIFPNAEEAACLTGTRNEAEQIRFLTARYDLAVIKRGAAGAEAANQSIRLKAPAPQVKVVDTTGAGDAFLAGFLAARLAGKPLDICLNRGVAAGAAATTVLGGRPTESLPLPLAWGDL
ncbi:carbohydrate kinase family protein [Kaistia granuli]|uniref:carbohydrate kinase family protein n=1 Tax=Kaistia granuli TaxID=363259 RepID=UPI00036A8812|nr:sugar kinase [Kaistia granuli]